MEFERHVPAADEQKQRQANQEEEDDPADTG